jgi:6,7-dimethyl-8-ribityllumazine synthase
VTRSDVTPKAILPNLSGQGLTIGIVQSRFNEPVVKQMNAACMAALVAHGVSVESIHHITVPGALEIPLTLQTMALTDQFDALIAIGAVIRGETYHFEIVSNDSSRGVMDVMLETGVPIANGILTCNTDEQALARVAEKGADCAKAAIEMANALNAVRKLKVS